MIGPKCQLCKRQRHHHEEKTLSCPIGKKSRVYGFSGFHVENRFKGKEKSAGGASEKRKDRKVRREVKSNPCCACGTKGTDWNPVDPAHIKTFKVSQSDHPANMIPLCRNCHREQHSFGWFLFLANYPHVSFRLSDMGWRMDYDPFADGRIIFTHAEIP